ncbi:hypothetical protein BKE38_18650 [Pseudoroseomonas deserti]|uniref:LysR substrate-binding domain-containing protein n=1 Tax=Teichococcus deserti TaxID=1817963 RepID=A0A1V2GYV2_9PROT|nr:hypothetical protein [Pseudoroseomonas deserti]ONG50273.1 hypothetical protein BKE38_18650 [Pseudoroseomonas deserti]
MGPEIPALLARLTSLDPALTVVLLVGTARALPDSFGSGRLDAIIIGRDDDRRAGEGLGPEHFGGSAAPAPEHRDGEKPRLATTSPCCTVRDVAARLAVAAVPHRLAPAETVDAGTALGLPALPSLSIVLHSSPTDPRTRETLRAITAAFREHRRISGLPGTAARGAVSR